MNLKARLEALEREMLGTPEKHAVEVMCRAIQGDQEAHAEVERIVRARPDILGGILQAYLLGPVSATEVQETIQ